MSRLSGLCGWNRCSFHFDIVWLLLPAPEVGIHKSELWIPKLMWPVMWSQRHFHGVAVQEPQGGSWGYICTPGQSWISSNPCLLTTSKRDMLSIALDAHVIVFLAYCQKGMISPGNFKSVIQLWFDQVIWIWVINSSITWNNNGKRSARSSEQ